MRESVVRLPIRVCRTSTAYILNELCESKGEKTTRTNKVLNQYFLIQVYRAGLRSLPHPPPVAHFPVPVPEGRQRRSDDILDFRYTIQILHGLYLFSSEDT